MGLFSTSSSPFDQKIEHATSDKNTTDDWGQIMLVCDKIKESPTGSADALKSITKRLHHEIPRVVLHTITLLDACINNCGRKFLLKVAERDFEQELQKLLTNPRTHHKVSEKLRECLKKWAEGEFKGDPELSLIPALYAKLLQQGYDFTASEDAPKKSVSYSSDPNVVNTQQEEDDIARAIQLSLQDSGSSTLKNSGVKQEPIGSSLYSNATAVLASSSLTPQEDAKEPLKVRALYDFEAAEDNELTFKAGEIILVIDHSDANWWKGSNHRGEGLFPSNFVTEDLTDDVESNKNEVSTSKKVSFSECVEVTEMSETTDLSSEITGEINEEKIDQLLHLLHEADPTGERPDDPLLSLLEEQINAMAPTIDAELEQIDRKHAELARISTDLVGALNLYQQLMREMPPSLPYYQPYKGLPTGPVSLPGQGLVSQYIPPGGAQAQIYPSGQYQSYPSMPGMPPHSYLPPQQIMAGLPQTSQGHYGPVPFHSNPPPVGDFQQMVPPSNFNQYPPGVPMYAPPVDGGPPMDMTSVSVSSQMNAAPVPPHNPTSGIPPQQQGVIMTGPPANTQEAPPAMIAPQNIPSGMPPAFMSQPVPSTAQQPLL